MGAIIDRDYFYDPADGYGESRVGTKFFGGIKTDDTIRFRLRDDDGIVMYGGAIDRRDVFGDDEDDKLYEILGWAEYDSGCTSAEVRAVDCDPAYVQRHKDIGCVTKDGKWVMPYWVVPS